MLNSQRADALTEGPSREWEYSGPGFFDLALGFLRRRYLAIVIFAAIGLAASFVLVKVLPPTFTAQATVLVVSSRVPSMQPQVAPDDSPIDVESQMEIFKSKMIAAAVINQLDLANDPDFANGSNWFSS